MSRIIHPSLSKLLFVLFAVLAVLIVVNADAKGYSGVAQNKAQSNGKKSSGTTSGRGTHELLMEIISSLSSIGGESVGQFLREMTDSFKLLTKGGEFAKSLNNPQILEACNFMIKASLTHLKETPRKFFNGTSTSGTVSSSDLNRLLVAYKDDVLKTLRSRQGFPTLLLDQVEALAPSMIKSLSEAYQNLVKTFPFATLTPNMVISGATYLDEKIHGPDGKAHGQYVDDATFVAVLHFPDQMFKNVEALISTLVTPQQLEMASMGLKMFALQQQAKPKPKSEPKSHEDL